MKKFSAEFLARLRESVQLDDLLGSHLNLQRTGGVSKARCPFHKDDSPSFAVYNDHFFCFGCGARGDAISFFERKDGLNFYEAVEKVSQLSGISIEFESSSDLESEASKLTRERLRKAKVLMTWVSEIYSQQLFSTEGQKARTYLLERGFDEKYLREYGLGMATSDSPIERSLRANKESLDLAKELKLVVENPNHVGEFRDFFRNRIMIPIQDEKGSTVAFGGRFWEGLLSPKVRQSADYKPPKYLNSSESFLYSKSSNLFLFHRAKPEIAKLKRAILVEGYFDALSLHRLGVPETVAVLSASAASKGLDLLTRSRVAEIFLAFDDDMAGQKGIVQFFKKVFKTAQFQVRCLRFSPFKDPDEYIRAKGRSGFLELLPLALPLLDRVFQIMCEESNAHSSELKLSTLRTQILPEVFEMEDKALQELALIRCAQLVGLSGPDLLQPRSFGKNSKAAQKPSESVNPTAVAAPKAPALIIPKGGEKGHFLPKNVSTAVSKSIWRPRPESFRLVCSLFFARHEDLPQRLRDLFEGNLLSEREHDAAQLCAQGLAFGLDSTTQDILRESLELHYYYGKRAMTEIAPESFREQSSPNVSKVANLCISHGMSSLDFEETWVSISAIPSDLRGKTKGQMRDESKSFTKVVLDATLKDLDACSKLNSIGPVFEKILLNFERSYVRHAMLLQTREALNLGHAEPPEMRKLIRLQEELSQKLESFDTLGSL
jgi:DNA primase catalytic core